MNEHPFSTAKSLYVALGDSRSSYALASETAKDARLRTVFTNIALERTPMMQALMHEMAVDGDELPTSGTMAGTVNRVWMRIRTSTATMGQADLLTDCISGERHLLEHYDHVLTSGKAPHWVLLLQRQRKAIAKNLAEMEKLQSRVTA